MRHLPTCLILTVLLATPAPGDESARLEACLAPVDDVTAARACIGLMADPCMEREGGHTTMGMFACMEEEYSAWDALLNRYWRPLRDKARAHDRAEAEYGAGAPGADAALLAAQRAWIAWRDAECAYASAEWGSGTGRGPAHVACLMQLTAERVIGFHFNLREGG